MIACPAGVIQHNLTFPECRFEVVVYCELTEKGQNNDVQNWGRAGIISLVTKGTQTCQHTVTSILPNAGITQYQHNNITNSPRLSFKMGPRLSILTTGSRRVRLLHLQTMLCSFQYSLTSIS